MTVDTDFANTMNVVLTGLSKGTGYRIRVAANTEAGRGIFSEFEETETLVDGEYWHRSCTSLRMNHKLA